MGARAASPARSVGGLRRGAIWFRSPRRFSFHRAGTETRAGSVPHNAADCATVRARAPRWARCPIPYQNLRVDTRSLLGVRNLMAIERWPEAERPRERLYWNGPEALADAELLAIQLGSGTRGKSAIDVAREMLAAYGSLAEVAGREVVELAKLSGIGPAKAARLVAAFELTRRLSARTPGVRVVLSGPAEPYSDFVPLMEDLKREVFRIALLDAQNGLPRDRVISQGTDRKSVG